MSRYLFLASDYKPNRGGIATFIDNLARGLIALGNTVKVVAIVDPNDTERGLFLENYEEWTESFPAVRDEKPKQWLARKLVSSLEIVRCSSPTARRWVDRCEMFRASSEAKARWSDILKREKPDVVIVGHLHVTFYPLVFPLLEQKIPFGLIAHDSEICRMPGRPNHAIKMGMVLRKAAWIAANSRHTRSLLEPWALGSDKTIIVHPPISQEALIESSRNGVTSEVFTLITVCRLVRGKGIDIVLRALKILSDRRVVFKYIIGGDGPERRALEELAHSLCVNDSVEFRGPMEECDKWSSLRLADVFVMPSRVTPGEQHEGFGTAFIEAAAFGVPAVGSRAGGIPDAVLDGVTGLLVEPDDPEELATVLMFLHEHPKRRRELGAAARKRAHSEFSPKTVATHFQAEIGRRI